MNLRIVRRRTQTVSTYACRQDNLEKHYAEEYSSQPEYGVSLAVLPINTIPLLAELDADTTHFTYLDDRSTTGTNDASTSFFPSGI